MFFIGDWLRSGFTPPYVVRRTLYVVRPLGERTTTNDERIMQLRSANVFHRRLASFWNSSVGRSRLAIGFVLDLRRHTSYVVRGTWYVLSVNEPRRTTNVLVI